MGMNKKHVLYDILRFGIYRERLSEYVTDTIRALVLELVGYHVKVFEFVSSEHTAKNIIMTAVLDDNRDSKEEENNEIKDKIKNLASLFGIQHQKLISLMGLNDLLLLPYPKDHVMELNQAFI